MPYLEFTRDRRGYEHTYVLHTYRVRGRSHTRILYWFRTPPHVKVGRAALDEDAIHAIEQGHPEIAFDWTRMLKEQPPREPQPPPADTRRPRGFDASRPKQARRSRPESSPPPPRAAESRPEPKPERTPPAVREPLAAALSQPDEERDPLASPRPESPVAELMGPEGLARVQARYAALLAQISDRVADPARREVLRLEAERLNPDAWVTAEETREGLEVFEREYDRIRAQLGGPPRSHRGGRRRRRHRTDQPAAGPEPSGESTDEGES